jgi:hypothetical protein
MPFGRQGERIPTELISSPTDGLIRATGTAMEEQMNHPPARAGQQLRGDAGRRPGQITTPTGDNDQRTAATTRRRQSRQSQGSGLSRDSSRRKTHGQQSK